MYFTACSFTTPVTGKTSPTGASLVKGDQCSHGLDLLAWEERLWDQGWFSWEEGRLLGAPSSIPGTSGVEESWALHSSACVAGGQEAAVQAER